MISNTTLSPWSISVISSNYKSRLSDSIDVKDRSRSKVNKFLSMKDTVGDKRFILIFILTRNKIRQDEGSANCGGGYTEENCGMSIGHRSRNQCN